MPAQKKIFTVQELVEKINDAKALYLTDYRGLNVDQMTDLRRAVKKAGGELEVAKNRLFKIALQNSVIKSMIDLTGPTAILWANEDEISPLKALVKFAQENELPELKIGFFNREILAAAKIKELAKIPSRSQLEAKLVSLLSGPIRGLTVTLNWNLQKLVFALKEISNQKETN